MEAGRRARKTSNVSTAVTVDARPFQAKIVLGEGIGVHPASGRFMVETYTCSAVNGVLPRLDTQWKVLGDVY